MCSVNGASIGTPSISTMRGSPANSEPATQRERRSVCTRTRMSPSKAPALARLVSDTITPRAAASAGAETWLTSLRAGLSTPASAAATSGLVLSSAGAPSKTTSTDCRLVASSWPAIEPSRSASAT